MDRRFVQRSQRRRMSRDNLIFDGLATLLLIGVLVIVLVPLWYVVVISFTPFSANQIHGYTLFLLSMNGPQKRISSFWVRMLL